MLASFSLAECFVRGFDTFPSIISNGEFDRIWSAPEMKFSGACHKNRILKVGTFLQAGFMLAYAIPKSGVAWTSDRILTLIFMIIGGFFVFSGLFIIYASICFFTLEGLEFMNIFTDGAREFGKYPFSIYGDGVLKFLTYVIPLALFQYYPFLYLTGKSDRILYMFLPLIAILFLVPCLLFWRFGLRHYKSTGS